MNFKMMLAAVLLVGACDGGDRYYNGCPVGEACSDGTPDGLVFVTAGVTGSLGGLAPTAIGGVQHVELTRGDNGADLNLPYTAETDGGAVEVAGTSRAIVTLHGAGTGDAMLRILDATTGELFDRKLTEAAKVATVAFTPTLFEAVPAGMPTAVMQGNPNAVVGLVAETTGARLVDETMQIDAGGAARRSWDVVDMTGVAVGPLALGVTLTDGTQFAATTTVVDGVDTIEQQPDDPNDPSSVVTTVREDQDTFVCFTPKRGNAFVLGAGMHFTSNDAAVGDNTLFGGNCTGIQAFGPGKVHVTATAGGASLTIELAVDTTQGAKRGVAVRGARMRMGAPVEGDRAAAVAGAR